LFHHILKRLNWFHDATFRENSQCYFSNRRNRRNRRNCGLRLDRKPGTTHSGLCVAGETLGLAANAAAVQCNTVRQLSRMIQRLAPFDLAPFLP